ncbi:MAG: hypothetical protein MUF25_20925 [Pirellulaceae bacterium]|nr:hypothetical protein [Pirellulaceae bacterium]
MIARPCGSRTLSVVIEQADLTAENVPAIVRITLDVPPIGQKGNDGLKPVRQPAYDWAAAMVLLVLPVPTSRWPQ